MAKVGRMNVQVTAGTSGLSRGLKESQTLIGRFSSSVGGVSGLLSKGFSGGVSLATKAVTGLGAAAAAGGGALAYGIQHGADAIDDLADSSKKLLGNNGATGALAGLRYAAEEAGVEAGALDKGLGKLLDTISKANRGDKGAIEAFRQIGLDAKDLQAMKPEDRMIAVADALGRVRDVGDKISFAKGIFGKAGEGLVPLFNEGGAAIRATTADMAMFGFAVSALDAEKVGTMNDHIGQMKLAFDGGLMQLAIQFAPIIDDVSMRILGFIEDIGGMGTAMDVAFGVGEEYAASFLDKVEDLEIGWLKLKRTVTAVGIIMADLGNGVGSVGNMATPWWIKWIQKKVTGGDETDKRLQMIAPDKRDEFKKRLDASGGFQSEKVDIGAGLRAENTDIQAEIADVEKRRREKGSLGDRFKGYVHKTKTNANERASEKLNSAESERLNTEEAITKELEKQTAEKEGQAGQGSAKLMAFNGPVAMAAAADSMAQRKIPKGGVGMDETNNILRDMHGTLRGGVAARYA